MISVIIPSLDGYRDGNVPGLVKELKEQLEKISQSSEIIIVKNVFPNGRSRDVGVIHSSGDYLIFIDDDVELGHNKVIKQIIDTLKNRKDIGLCGPSQQIKEGYSFFQKWCARDIPRNFSAIVKDYTDSDMVSHMCLAMRREDFYKLGWEHPNLISGTDPDLRKRVRDAGLRVCIIPDCLAYHPPFSDIKQLIKKSFNSGKNACWVNLNYPQFSIDTFEHTNTKVPRRRNIFYKILRRIINIIKSIITLRLLFFINNIVYGIGFIYEYIFRTVKLKNKVHYKSPLQGNDLEQFIADLKNQGEVEKIKVK